MSSLKVKWFKTHKILNYWTKCIFTNKMKSGNVSQKIEFEFFLLPGTTIFDVILMFSDLFIDGGWRVTISNDIRFRLGLGSD